MERLPKVTVVGSVNMDLTVSTSMMPEQGETVLGDRFATFPGGKGANQAVAAVRIGADVSIIGAVGNDVFGAELLSHLKLEGMDTEGVRIVEESSTGTATIILSDKDNRIIVAPGANLYVTPDHVEKHREIVRNSDVILVQLEIPLETIHKIAEMAEEYEIPLIINPAPYQPVSAEVLKKSAFLTPNEKEAILLRESASEHNIEQKLITTLGERGVTFIENGVRRYIGGHKVNVVDTTGAGDTFNGVFASQIAAGKDIGDAVRFANYAAALSVQKPGAQSGMPLRGEVEQYIKERRGDL